VIESLSLPESEIRSIDSERFDMTGVQMSITLELAARVLVARFPVSLTLSSHDERSEFAIQSLILKSAPEGGQAPSQLSASDILGVAFTFAHFVSFAVFWDS